MTLSLHDTVLLAPFSYPGRSDSLAGTESQGQDQLHLSPGRSLHVAVQKTDTWTF